MSWLDLQWEEAETLEDVYGDDGGFMWLNKPEGSDVDDEMAYSVTLTSYSHPSTISITFIVTLPSGYPLERSRLPEVVVEEINPSEEAVVGEDISKYLLKHVKAQLESGYVFPLVAALESTRQYITEVATEQQDTTEDRSTPEASSAAAKEEVLGRRMMVVHTIKNPMKIKFIRELAKDYRLGGMSNPNFILIEGEENLCADYVNRVTRYVRMVTVRGEEQIPVPAGKTLDDMRALPVEFTQYKVDEVSKIAERCREAGLEELFMTSMKVYTTTDEEGDHEGKKEAAKKKRPYPKREDGDCIQLQLEEAEALESVYSGKVDSEFMWLHKPEGADDGETAYAITVRGDVISDEEEEGEEPYATFMVTLPPGYPKGEGALPDVIAVEGSKPITPKLRKLDENLMGSIKAQMEAGYDYPVLAALEGARAAINKIAVAAKEAERSRKEREEQSNDDDVAWAARVPIRGATKKVTVHLSARKKKTNQPPVLGRRVIYAHHIRNPVKKKLIKEWAKELHMGGCYKWGYPGVIILEGDEQDCAEYVNLINRLRWMYLAVRGEEQIPVPEGKSVDDIRAFPKDEFIEYGPDQMSDIAARCREYGLEELFLTCMKMYGPVRANKNDKQHHHINKKQQQHKAPPHSRDWVSNDKLGERAQPRQADPAHGSRRSSGRDTRESSKPPCSVRAGMGMNLGRRLLYFHHIRNLKKKKLLRTWADELDLGGLYKWGYPGVVVVEGEDANCDEFVKLVKSLRWRLVAVHGEEKIPLNGRPVDAVRALPRDFTEYRGPDNMQTFAAELRDRGVLFGGGLRMYGSPEPSLVGREGPAEEGSKSRRK
ncbi:hypothetical protein FOL46_009799 [Perkinsus olseni]|uniref:RWD domain-containing protein n=1 Tax=Perkinsus olseni TaxID=32597 RepID=A0A7J6MJW9_PEROL|nr:hypothetical protein FOL46_009799 [Perkinsus olseni]